MIEKLKTPRIELQYGGPALADEVFDAFVTVHTKINEIIEEYESITTSLKSKPTENSLGTS